MSLATDQLSSSVPLSSTSMRMLELREVVLALWEQRVRADVAQAASLQHPLLVDTLPAFYDNVAESVTAAYPRATAVDGTTAAAEHGGERARLTNYDHRAVIDEYQLLRWAIFEVLHLEQVLLTREEIHAINASLDAAIQEAVETFTLVHSGLRERLAAALTHDLRGPLSAAYTALQIILLSDDLAKIRLVAGKAMTNIKRVSGMVDEMLDTMAFHGGQKLQLQVSNFDIDELIEEVQTDAVTAHGSRFQVIACSAEGWWDRSALKRAVENLVSNAVKYGNLDSPIKIKIAETHERLILSVHNEGNPIPIEEHVRIFQMYGRAQAAKDGPKEGWGIGLPYVRTVAESHAGSVSVDSSTERGTTFLIDIPVDIRPYLV